MDYEIFDKALKVYGDVINDTVEKIDTAEDKNNNTNIKKIKQPGVKSRKACKHINVIDDNGIITCFDCNQQLEKGIFHDKEWRFFGYNDNKRHTDPNRVHMRKNDDRNIISDVSNMGFTDKIISTANKIYLDVTKGKISRGNARKSLVFASIFHSYKVHGKALSHEKLIEIFQLNRKSALRGLQYVSLNASKDSVIHVTYITPLNIIDDIMDKFKVTDKHKKEVRDLYDKIKNKSSKINRSRPRSIASGLVFFWICLNNIDISLKSFAKKVDLSELTISKLSKEISNVLDIVPECWI
jgi:transcription initiation factor TFIIIB Brf1 subunit/transcription initiation factor TFIIB